jgi:hypothetical protein
MDKDRKKELSAQYKQAKKQAGVYRIYNKENHKSFVASAPDLTSVNGRKFMLETGKHDNKMLQDEWNQYGEKAFVFEILEVLMEKDEPFYDKRGELKKLEEKWLEKLQPFGDRGYNNPVY